MSDLSSNPRALIENLVGYVKETTDHPGFVKALQAIELALSPAAKFDDLKKQCQCLWRTDATLVCRLPKGHEGHHREGAFTWNGEVDTRAAHEPNALPLHGVPLDRPIWICSMCHGWNHVQDKHCTHTHAVTKSAGECGACDKPGEHCANVHGICSRHGGRAHETKGGQS